MACEFDSRDGPDSSVGSVTAKCAQDTWPYLACSARGIRVILDTTWKIATESRGNLICAPDGWMLPSRLSAGKQASEQTVSQPFRSSRCDKCTYIFTPGLSNTSPASARGFPQVVTRFDREDRVALVVLAGARVQRGARVI